MQLCVATVKSNIYFIEKSVNTFISFFLIFFQNFYFFLQKKFLKNSFILLLVSGSADWGSWTVGSYQLSVDSF